MSPLNPSSPYSASKAGADLLVASYRHTYGLETLICRGSNNYGPFQYPEKLIPLMVLNALHGDKLPVYGDGQQVRNWIFVEDFARGIGTVLERGEPGEVYNVGGPDEAPNLDVVHKIIEYTGRDESLIEYVTDRPGHDRRYSLASREGARSSAGRRRCASPRGLRAHRELVSRQRVVVGADPLGRVPAPTTSGSTADRFADLLEDIASQDLRATARDEPGAAAERRGAPRAVLLHERERGGGAACRPGGPGPWRLLPLTFTLRTVRSKSLASSIARSISVTQSPPAVLSSVTSCLERIVGADLLRVAGLAGRREPIDDLRDRRLLDP